MRYLGIDYGDKKVGVALSDEDGKIAMPYTIISNFGDENMADKIINICLEKNVGKIVIGESLDYRGRPNHIMEKIKSFRKVLESKTYIPIFFHPEVLSTMEASRLGGKNKNLDDSAAAIVLQSFIEKDKLPL